MRVTVCVREREDIHFSQTGQNSSSERVEKEDPIGSDEEEG